MELEKSNREECDLLVEEIIDMATTVRKEGILKLENYTEQMPENSWIRLLATLILDATDRDLIAEIINNNPRKDNVMFKIASTGMMGIMNGIPPRLLKITMQVLYKGYSV